MQGVCGVAASRRGEGASIDLKDVRDAACEVFVPVITAVSDVLVVIKKVHAVVQIIEERAQLQKIALSSDVPA